MKPLLKGRRSDARTQRFTMKRRCRRNSEEEVAGQHGNCNPIFSLKGAWFYECEYSVTHQSKLSLPSTKTLDYTFSCMVPVSCLFVFSVAGAGPPGHPASWCALLITLWVPSASHPHTMKLHCTHTFHLKRQTHFQELKSQPLRVIGAS